MTWDEIRSAYTNKWLVVEALVAHTDPNNKRIISDFKVIEICSDGISAFNKYRQLHKLEPCKEFYYLNTKREVLEIEERKWIGIRIKSADSTQV